MENPPFKTTGNFPSSILVHFSAIAMLVYRRVVLGRSDFLGGHFTTCKVRGKLVPQLEICKFLRGALPGGIIVHQNDVQNGKQCIHTYIYILIYILLFLTETSIPLRPKTQELFHQTLPCLNTPKEKLANSSVRYFLTNQKTKLQLTWRIIPVGKWLATPVYKPFFKAIWKGIPQPDRLGTKTALTLVVNHLHPRSLTARPRKLVVGR